MFYIILNLQITTSQKTGNTCVETLNLKQLMSSLFNIFVKDIFKFDSKAGLSSKPRQLFIFVFILLYIFRNIEVHSFRSWQNCIKKFKWLKKRMIQKWRIPTPLKTYSSPIINIFWNLFFNGWVILLFYKTFSGNVFNGLLNKNCPKILTLSIGYFPIPRYNV